MEVKPQPDPSPASRRDFLTQAALLVAAAKVGLSARPASAQQTPAAAASPLQAPKDNLVGIQMGPHTLCDEGVDHVLDLIQQHAAINTIFIYSHAYGGDLRKNANILAQDHGSPPRDQRQRNLPLVWVKQHDEYFKNTTLRHPKIDASYEYSDRDIFVETLAPARKRGMKVYARILEAGPHGIVNWDKIVTIDVTGRPTTVGCWNHPEYRAFWNATAEDLFKSYELDGFQWGAERSGPLCNTILNGRDSSATCFCDFCKARGKSIGIDADRARKGFAEIAAYVRALQNGGAKPADGALAGFLRIFFHYPEVLAWELQYRLSREEVLKGIYDTIKKIKPAAPVGWHVDHWAVCMDPFYRAQMPYADQAPYSDFLKIVVYHACAGPRTHTYLSNLHRGVLSDIPLDELFNLHYDLLGYDKTKEPTAEQAQRQGFSPEYVHRETKHAVASSQGKSKIYPGIGFNVPSPAPDDPETIYQCILKAYEAGASGFVASREYEEMTIPNLNAVGRAVRSLKA